MVILNYLQREVIASQLAYCTEVIALHHSLILHMLFYNLTLTKETKKRSCMLPGKYIFVLLVVFFALVKKISMLWRHWNKTVMNTKVRYREGHYSAAHASLLMSNVFMINSDEVKNLWYKSATKRPYYPNSWLASWHPIWYPLFSKQYNLISNAL